MEEQAQGESVDRYLLPFAQQQISFIQFFFDLILRGIKCAWSLQSQRTCIKSHLWPTYFSCCQHARQMHRWWAKDIFSTTRSCAYKAVLMNPCNMQEFFTMSMISVSHGVIRRHSPGGSSCQSRWYTHSPWPTHPHSKGYILVGLMSASTSRT
jgi:hypothetical protein